MIEARGTHRLLPFAQRDTLLSNRPLEPGPLATRRRGAKGSPATHPHHPIEFARSGSIEKRTSRDMPRAPITTMSLPLPHAIRRNLAPNSEIYPNIFLSEKEKFGGYSWSWAWKPRSAYVEFRIFLDINKGKRLSRSHAHGNPMGTAPFAAE
jgi:hypothetical protein